jgi:putative ABC transport system substrate-binding protein
MPIERRLIFPLLGTAAIGGPFRVFAQSSKLPRIGILVVANSDAESLRRELRAGLNELGRVEERDFLFDFRAVPENQVAAAAVELTRLKVDVIVALNTICALAAKVATREIPIVILSGDPVGTGLVASLARPGGNITGISLVAAELFGKCVELFHDLLSSAKRIAVLGNALDAVFAKAMVGQVELVGRQLNIETQPIRLVQNTSEIAEAFAAIKEARADAVIVQGSLSTKGIADLAIEHRLPTASGPQSFVNVGGLMTYGAHGPSTFRRTAVFVHKILNGGNPGELPVEQPTRFALALNLKTAKAIALTIPEPFLSRADMIVE